MACIFVFFPVRGSVISMETAYFPSLTERESAHDIRGENAVPSQEAIPDESNKTHGIHKASYLHEYHSQTVIIVRS